MSARPVGVVAALVILALSGCGGLDPAGTTPSTTEPATAEASGTTAPVATTTSPPTPTSTSATTTTTTTTPTTTTTVVATTTTHPPATTTTTTTTTTAAPVVVTVAISGFAFHPSDITIVAGTKVKWVNDDGTTHTTSADLGAWTHTLAPGEGYRRTFDTPGVYAYHCAIHPSMTGTITVTG